VTDPTCQAVREALEEGRSLPGWVSDHLDGCASCRHHGVLLSALAHLEPAPEASDDRVDEIMSALPRAPWQQPRLVSWLPAAAGLALVALGLALLGGVPAAGAMAALPHLASSLTAWLASSCLDALAAVRGGATATHLLLATEGLWLLWVLLAAVAGGGAAVRALARRRRRSGA
jgi:hypothetical protein